MRNMGQESTLSFSMVRDGELVGMITCSHDPSCGSLSSCAAASRSSQPRSRCSSASLDQKERLSRQATIRKTEGCDDGADRRVRRHGLFSRQRSSASATSSSQTASPCASGAGPRATGDVPPAAALEALHTLEPQGPRQNHSSATLSLVTTRGSPRSFPLSPACSWCCWAAPGDYIAFFRNEVLRKVDWLGDQTSANRQTALSPRTSFSSWSGSVSGTAKPWGEIESRGRRARSRPRGSMCAKPNQRSSTSPTTIRTGLPNRRRLMEQLELALRWIMPRAPVPALHRPR